ncbi:MAG: pyridine nucleotide-disulfide oxidoreductase, partial [Bacteroidales bacterium]|nr:pyridine nucleotide-disulfide oxidoreductase [Bacteroidales bacterium]
MKKIILILSALSIAVLSYAQGIFVEAESFTDKGGWSLDQQFMDIMGSPYLIAHGMGVPVQDAS